jgi:short-subunit dehydrogenase
MSSTSEIAESLAQLYLNKSDTLLLHGRSREKLDSLVTRLREIEPKADLVRLPLMDLVVPRYSVEPVASSNLDLQYAKWFDDVVYEYGLPNYMIIAGGGTSSYMKDSGVVHLNILSTMLCCEHYLRKIEENAHNQKYSGKIFRVVYFGSGAADIRYTTYCRAKWMIEKYMDTLRRGVSNQLETNSEIKKIHFQYAKIGPVDTKMLSSYRHKIWNSREKSIVSRMVRWGMIKVVDLFKVTPDDVAKSIYYGIEMNRSNFYAPTFMGYMSMLGFPFFWIVRRFMIN